MGLLREMQMLMAQQPAAPPSGLTLVNAITLIPSGTTKSSYTINIPEAIQAGDQVIVACNYNSTLTSIAFSDTFDTAGTTYTTSVVNSVPTGLQQCAIKTFTSARAAGSVTISAIPNVNTKGQMVVYHLRGGSLSIGTANVLTYYSPAGTPLNGTQTFGPYSNSGAGFMVAIPATNAPDSSFNSSISGATGWTIDLEDGITYCGSVMHKLNTAPVSGDSFTYTTNSTSNGRFSYLFVPFA